jgi:hypothetical protein
MAITSRRNVWLSKGRRLVNELGVVFAFIDVP